MKKIPTIFPEIFVIQPDVFNDPRGFFFESYSYKKYAAFGINDNFIQDNHSKSTKNTVRGLHFQALPGQVKLVHCVHGKIWDVVVDIRPSSPNFRKWFGVELSDTNFQQIYIPVGFAHGFSVISEVAEVEYKVNNYYDPTIERGIRWNDQTIGVDWKVSAPVLSKRDELNSSLDELIQKHPDPFKP